MTSSGEYTVTVHVIHIMQCQYLDIHQVWNFTKLNNENKTLKRVKFLFC